MTFYLKTDNTADVLNLVLRDAAGTPKNITGASSVRLHLINAYGNLVLDEEMTVVDEAAGEVQYIWAAGDLEQAMVYQGEVEVIYSTGLRQSFPNNENYIIEVERKLA